MIVCAQCGERNAEGAEFCGSCGTYLEWEPKPDRQPVPAPPPAGWPGRAPGPPPGWPGPPAGRPPGPPGPGPGRPPGPHPGTQPGMPPVPPQHTPHQPAPQQPVPQPAPQQPGPQQPGAMQPTDQRQAPPGHRPRLTERRAAQPGDLICGQCGEANPPVRKFCARCGAGLVEAQVVAEKWWRRIFPRRQPAKAGTRHRRRGTVGRTVGRVVRWALAVLLLGGVGAYALVSPFREAVNTQAGAAVDTVRDWFSEQARPVRPSQVTASASVAGHGPDLVADNAKNTYWAAPAQPPPALVFTFEAPVTFTEAIFQIGIGEKFQTAQRPNQVHLVYSNGKTFDLSLTDQPDPQTVKIGNADGVRTVELYIVSTYPSLQGTDVAISEIEFFTVE